MIAAIYTWAKENPIEAVLLASLFVGALGDIGRIIEPKSPTIARVFKTLSSLGISVLGVVRGVGPRVETPSKDERGAATVDVMATLAGVAGAAVLGYLVAGCSPTASAAAYGAKLEACLQTSQTCEQYIECRDRAQVAEGRGHYQATCADAGSAEGGAK